MFWGMIANTEYVPCNGCGRVILRISVTNVAVQVLRKGEEVVEIKIPAGVAEGYDC